MTIERIHTDAAPAAVGPYSQATRASGQFLFTAGQIALDPTTQTFRGDLDVQGQAELALSNLSAVLEAGGAGLDSVLKTTVFLTTMDHFGPMNEVYARFFGDTKPARSAVAAAELPLGALFEIECIALVK
ncbi:MAG: 2-iminobutanoate/2-iminopropanoate deaminase [Bradymonadia bacterium]|jgi:2-iminobutanoate/2-iminopropanoate deaminase